MIFFDSQLAYESEIIDKWLEKEMHTQKKAALRKLSSIVAHFKIEIFNMAYSWFNSFPNVEKIAEELDLSKMDLKQQLHNHYPCIETIDDTPIEIQTDITILLIKKLVKYSLFSLYSTHFQNKISLHIFYIYYSYYLSSCLYTRL
ncbi:MAG: hypothetical protein AB7F64_10130 [Gammaproteobacteria bacterium]